MGYTTIDLTGQQFGKLTVINQAPSNKHGQARWNCQCECGKKIIVSGYILRQRKQCSCSDCYHKSRITHDLSDHPLYKTWQNMKNRCYLTTHPSYKGYGARGITVCEDWRVDFVTFYEWSISNGWGEGLSIDRIDVNGNYEPSNCRWVDDSVQANNKRKTLKFNYNGQLRTITELAEIANMPRYNIYNRLIRYGWSVERTMSTPIQSKERKDC